jgi:hypothetical protein
MGDFITGRVDYVQNKYTNPSKEPQQKESSLIERLFSIIKAPYEYFQGQKSSLEREARDISTTKEKSEVTQNPSSQVAISPEDPLLKMQKYQEKGTELQQQIDQEIAFNILGIKETLERIFCGESKLSILREEKKVNDNLIASMAVGPIELSRSSEINDDSDDDLSDDENFTYSSSTRNEPFQNLPTYPQ